jgi:predicted NBD/HSP70 family sugar kinase
MRARGPRPSSSTHSAGGAVPAMLGQMTDETFLGILFTQGATSRAGIAKLTGISRPTMSESAQRLLASGHIVEVGQTAGQRGRSAVLYDLNPDHGYTFATSIERGRVVASAHNYRGDLIWEQQRHVTGEDLRDHISAACTLVEEVRQRATPMLAAAVSVAAPVDPHTQTVRSLPGAPIAGVAAGLADALGLSDVPTEVDNDVNWAAIAEHRAGCMQDVDDFLFIYLGAGVGAGLFLSGRPYRGAHGTAGEIAFLQMPEGDTLMRKLGISEVGTPDGHSVDLEAAREMLSNADHPATQAIVADLTRVFVNVTTILDPEHIVLGGPLTEFDALASQLRERIESQALSPVQVVRSTVAGSAPLVGAQAGARDIVKGVRHQGMSLR